MSQHSLFPDSAADAEPQAAPLVDNHVFKCPRCGFDKYIDAPIHNGESLRRDCARCHRTVGFPIWYGKPQANVK
jgi:hypothetical protein